MRARHATVDKDDGSTAQRRVALARTESARRVEPVPRDFSRRTRHSSSVRSGSLRLLWLASVLASVAGAEPPEPAGSLPKERIGSVIRAERQAIERCYALAMGSGPRLEGQVALEFTIGREGDVTQVSVANDTVGLEPLTGCMVRVVRGMHFPKPTGGVVKVKYPWVFKSVADAGVPDAGSSS